MRIRVFGHYIYVPLLVLLVLEGIAFAASLYAGAILRLGFPPIVHGEDMIALWPRALVFAAVTSTCFLALGLYTPRQRARVWGVALRIGIAMLASLAVLALLFYLISPLELGPGVIGGALLIAALASLVIRYLFWRVIDTQALKRRVIIYGQAVQMEALTLLRRRSDRAGFNLLGVVHAAGDRRKPLGEKVFEAPDGLKSLCEELGVDELVVAFQDRRQNLPLRDLLQCRLAGIAVTEFISFMERETGRIRLDMLNPSWMIFGPGFRRDGLRKFTAKVLDFVASFLLMLIASPVILATMLAIWLEDGRLGHGIFFLQDRVGFDGNVFRLIKFRSMRADAESSGVPQWARRNDPRVTRVGAFIRRSRIDELPQLINVLKGNMGFVGPRPERPEFVAELEASIPYYAFRHSVKPGITGWAQLCYPYGSSIEDARQKLQYDLYYVKNNTLLFDLTILLQTVEVVFMGKGAR